LLVTGNDPDRYDRAATRPSLPVMPLASVGEKGGFLGLHGAF
jgi:hypothetical protein